VASEYKMGFDKRTDQDQLPFWRARRRSMRARPAPRMSNLARMAENSDSSGANYNDPTQRKNPKNWEAIE